MTENYKTKRIIDKKIRQIIVDENGKIVNRKPSKEELKGLEEEPYKWHVKNSKKYTKEQLLWYLVQFYEKYGRPPTKKDFTNNSEYPSYETYRRVFGSWSNALKLVELDVESMVKKGIIETDDQKARFSEIIVRDSFDNPSVDLAGDNKKSHCDGICPNGKTYDVKSSKLYIERYYGFNTRNKYKDEIEIYYLLGFNEDYTRLDYGWRIPGEIVEKDQFLVGLSSSYEFNIENMKQYDITDKLVDVFVKTGYFEKIENYRKAKEKGLTIYEYDKQLYDGYIVAE